ncbi:MAG: exonuclease SbcCD subunit D [Sarcina sp.]
MKIFHTGDWHIGKLVNSFYMTEDQKYILDQLFEKIKTEKPDCVIIAGDIYDRSIPPVEAVDLLNETLNKIIFDLNTPVISIAGNHDSSERIGFGDKLYEKAGFYVSGELKKEVKKVVLEDEDGKVNFYLIPYADPYYVRQLFNDDEIKTHEDAVKKVIETISFNKEERNVAVFHGYVSKGAKKIVESESEKRLSIGGTEVINSSIFKDFDYVALGHIHKRQRVDGDRIRYAGSLMKYSFSEMNNKVGVIETILNKDKSIESREIDFQLKRDFRELRGKLEDLISVEYSENQKKDDYIKVVLENNRDVVEPMQRLRGVYPNIMELRYEDVFKAIDLEEERLEGLKNKSPFELTVDFFTAVGREDVLEGAVDIVKDVLNEVIKGEK